MQHGKKTQLTVLTVITAALAMTACSQSTRQASANNKKPAVTDQPQAEHHSAPPVEAQTSIQLAELEIPRHNLEDKQPGAQTDARSEVGILQPQAPGNRTTAAEVGAHVEVSRRRPLNAPRFDVPPPEAQAPPAAMAQLAPSPAASPPRQRPPRHDRAPHSVTGRENYAHYTNNPLRDVQTHPVSTFSVDVDTGSYTNVRRMLKQGRLPPSDAVRAEEFVNYFDYQYPTPTGSQHPFSISTEVGPTPWNSRTHLLQIGLQGQTLAANGRVPRNLVFLIDVSGSMRGQDKLALLKPAMKLMTNNMQPSDRICIVVYAGAAGAVLQPTSGSEKQLILSAIDSLNAGGSTNGGAGIDLAYAMARKGYIDQGINRIVLATDGDFNVGTVDFQSLKNRVASERPGGVELTTLGFGQGNINDHLMEQLANAGNGNYFYIDTLSEAHKVLVKDLAATLHTIAADVKIQIEFNPAIVSEYRLIGYENRGLNREDFSNDRVDAGEIGAGHRVTALYEVALRGGGGERLSPLRYQQQETLPVETQEMAFVRLRYKPTVLADSVLREHVVGREDVRTDLAGTSDRFRFAAAVSAFAQHLQGAQYLEDWSMEQIRALARGAKGEDKFGYRAEFIQLVDLAGAIKGSDYRSESVAVRTL